MNCFVACGSDKASSRCKARDMYTGEVFKKSLEYAESLKPDKLYILSGKHELLDPNKEIDPYNLYIGDKSSEWRKEWAERVIDQMKAAHIDFNTKTYFMAGEDYIQFLRDQFPNRVEVFKGKQFGEIMHYLNGKLGKNESSSLSEYLKECLNN